MTKSIYTQAKMLGVRLCQVALANPAAKSFTLMKTTISLRPVNYFKSSPLIRNNGIRKFMDSQRDRISHAARRKTLREQALAPAGETAFSVGKGALAGASALGLGALCYYGLGMSSQAGVMEKAV